MCTIPHELKEKYQFAIECDHDLFVSQSLNESGIDPIKLSEKNTQSFVVFAKEYNSIILTAHLFENLLMLEDMRHEDNGHGYFQIEIPTQYFRYPALNNSRDPLSYKEMSDKEASLITEVITTTKEEMHYSKDENIVKENLHKLEFLSMFSFFEAYLENILVEKLGYSELEASKKAKYNSLDKLLLIVLDEVNTEAKCFLKSIKQGIFKFIEFSYLVRNLHTHNLGRTNEKFIRLCTERGLIAEQFGTTKNGDKVSMGIRTSFGHPEKIIENGRYITLSVISYEFRNYVRETINIIESCIKHNELESV